MGAFYQVNCTKLYGPNTIDLEQQIIDLDKYLIFRIFDNNYLKVVKKFAYDAIN